MRRAGSLQSVPLSVSSFSHRNNVSAFSEEGRKSYRSDSDNDAKRLFGFSILYLFLLLAGLLANWAIGLI